MDTILITGASGFIGKNLCKYFSTSRKVIGLSRNINSKKSSNNYLHKNLLIEEYNPKDTKNISLILKKYNPKEIIHAAGLINGTYEELAEANQISSYCLVEAIKISNLNPILILISSVSAEFDTLYGASKLKGESEILKYNNNRVLILRLSMVYGMGHDKNLFLFESLLKKSPLVPVPFSKTCVLQPLFIDDISKLINLFIEGKGISKKIYTLAGPDKLNLIDIVKVLKLILKSRSLVLPIPIKLIRLGLAFFLILPFLKRFIPYQQISTLDSQPTYDICQTQEEFGFLMTRFKTGASHYLK